MNHTTRILLLVASGLAISACDKTPADNAATNASDMSISAVDQAGLDLLADTLDVKYRLNTNIVEQCPGEDVKQCYHATIELTSPSDILVNNWQLYYSQVYPTYFTESNIFELVHVNGDLHKISPKDSFQGFKANTTYKIDVYSKSALLTESELMPNYFLTSADLSPQVIESTKIQIDPETGLELQPYVVDFPNQHDILNFSKKAKNELATSRYLYQSFEQSAQPVDVSRAITPTPKMVKFSDDNSTLDLAAGLKVNVTNLELAEIEQALAHLQRLGINQSSNGVALNVSVNTDLGKQAGGYTLAVTDNEITVVGVDATGAFYGVQSLASLVSLGSTTVAKLQVEDEPRYQYRGQHIDVGRNFHSKEFMLALIEQMASLKMNKLHLHLAEDEGWRIEIPGLEELTEVGARRCMDLSDTECMQPQLGGAGSPERDGYYTVADYIEIVRYADQHHIEVIPSLDMPGHSRAAVKAMEARYHKFMQQEKPEEAVRYLLTDLEDKTQYSSIQHYNDNTINVCLESSYTFFDKVIDEIKIMHEQAGQPLNIYHIGADETAGAWVESEPCKALMADKSKNIKDGHHLGVKFIERVSHILANKGLAVGGWSDGMGETSAENMPNDVWSYIWTTLPGGAHKTLSKHQSNGWNVVLSIPDVYYFDFPYQVDPKEPGYKWASRQTNSRDVFTFMPDNIPLHAEFRKDTSNLPYEANDTVQTDDAGNVIHKPLPKEYRVNGIQGQIWSETIRTREKVEYMLYPRLFAVAERAWHEAEWEVPYNSGGAIYNQESNVFTDALQQKQQASWQTFANVIGKKLLPKLDAADIFYRIPTVGAVIKDNQLHANIALPGLTIEYKDGNGPWTTYAAPIAVKGEVTIRARSTDGKRAGRSLIVK